MDLTDPIVWQGLAATGLGALIVLGSAWWLYLSPVRTSRATPLLTSSPRLVAWLVLALGLAALQFVVGGLWDASQHIKTGLVVGGADFLWPSHIVLYGSFLLALVAASTAMTLVALPAWRRGIRDPRLWVRQQPYLALIALASAYELLAIPGDALWHLIFGVDLTAWSPPHLLLAGMMGFVQIGAIGLLRTARTDGGARGWADGASVLLLGLALNAFYLVGVLEWELPVERSPLVLARPVWMYPVVSAGLAFAVLVLARVLVGGRWAATAAALVFYAVRLVLTLGLASTDNVAPMLPLVPVLGALLLDLSSRLPMGRLSAAGFSAAAYTVGFDLLALPMLGLRSDLASFSAADDVLTVLATFLMCLVLFPMLADIGQALRGLRESRASSRVTARSAAIS
jgi:hypothetical protein